MRRVINATGIILHTGAGRAPLGPTLVAAAAAALEGYSNLEVDLLSGERGQRNALIAEPLGRLTAAEDAVVVNNNAGAVLLALHALAGGKPAAASRGELVEIGGAFRLPAVMAAGGVELRPVGTVNVVRLEDYRQALEAGASLVVCAHRSNFFFRGPHEEPPLKEVVALAREHGTRVLYDLGSGLLSNKIYEGLIPADEPSVESLLAAGVDVVCFSGDKLLGGPQAGIAVGRASAITLMQGDSLYRALRVGKETYALLGAVLAAYLEGGPALAQIPTYRLLKRSPEELKELATRVAGYVEAAGLDLTVGVAEDTSFCGGGTLPALRLATYAVTLRHKRMAPHELSAALRALRPPVLARATGDALLLDVRSVLESDLPLLEQALRGLAAAQP